MKDELNGQMVRLREECANRVSELEKQLDTAHGNRMSSMFQMKDEVESEFTERMEQLRDMYKRELEMQAWIDRKQYKSSCSRVCFDFLIRYFDEFFCFWKFCELDKLEKKSFKKSRQTENGKKSKQTREQDDLYCFLPIHVGAH